MQRGEPCQRDSLGITAKPEPCQRAANTAAPSQELQVKPFSASKEEADTRSSSLFPSLSLGRRMEAGERQACGGRREPAGRRRTWRWRRASGWLWTGDGRADAGRRRTLRRGPI
ncbi:hypothetical protein C2845_PM07G24120 [Panicum miliaceum]|uniref:Uncharacterized protein n=1 Tax=Panicum miliaceum TaxID=4540 RepID=A0A3L6STC2_PANMI|nr:hypothetical protein C2845_PM07G24120 [Panicum miliaceum]